MINVTGKTILIQNELLPKTCESFRYCNQRCRSWSYPYEYVTWPNETLSTAGCGLFSLAHCVEWLTGQRLELEPLSDFSRAHGGRGDDGTDRPVLLAALEAAGKTREMGFTYRGDGLRNDHEALWTLIAQEGGVALANLRVGHIVALVKARTANGERQLLAIDSVAETCSERIRDFVREGVPGTETTGYLRNGKGEVTGFTTGYAMFWVPLVNAIDFNLLHRRT